MRSLKITFFLFFVSTFLTLAVSESAAQWWKKSRPASEKAAAEETSVSEKASASERTFVSEKDGSKGEKTQKGLFIRFPWARKGADEVADPFGNVKEEAPAYQNLEELGIRPAASQMQTADAVPSTSDASVSSARAGSALGVSQEAAWLQKQTQAEEPNAFRLESASTENGANASLVPIAPAAPVSAPAEPQNAYVAGGELPTSLGPTPAPAPENSAVGTAVELPSPEAAQSAIQAEIKTEEANQPQSDIIFKQVPSLMADTSKLAGEGIQFYAQGQAMAQVGSSIILAGDIMGTVDRIMEENRAKIPEQYWDAQREMLTRMVLNQSIEAKLIYCDVLRSVPAEGIKQNFELIDKLFEDSELPARMKREGIQLREEYEKKLVSQGTSIQKQKYLYREAVFCQQWLMKSVPQSPSVSWPEIDDYYHSHLKEFETPPRARWEELVVRKSRFYSRDEAYQEMVRIGSMAAVQKVPFADVAKQFSHGVTASTGGAHDWIKPGQLASKPLEDAVFSQPLNALSEKIIEDESCFYVIRVLERDPLVRKPLADAQSEIREKIKKLKTDQAKEEFLAKLKKEIPVFTIFDGIPSPEERMKAEQEAAMKTSGAGSPFGMR